MKDSVVVTTKRELKEALKSKAPRIEIRDRELVKHVQRIKMANKAGILAVAGAAGVAAYNWWNPVGWTSGVVLGFTATTTSGGAAATGAYALGIGGVLLIALYKDYDIKASYAGVDLELKSRKGRK